MISVHGLTKRYGGRIAVDDLTFDVQPGTVTGFLGPNGSGKSTTMRLLLGLAAPDAGTALIAGVPYRSLRWPLRTVGAVLDARAFQPGRSGRGHLLALAAAGGLPRQRVEEVLTQVGLAGGELGDAAGRQAGGYSLGMAQRLSLAAALLGDPAVLLLDEPLNGLDPAGVHWMRSLIKAQAAQGRTVLVSSHLISEMALTAGPLIVIGGGRLLAGTTVAELTARGRGSLENGFLALTGAADYPAAFPGAVPAPSPDHAPAPAPAPAPGSERNSR
jgi:ABC-2 type transport system ATP-binding protein